MLRRSNKRKNQLNKSTEPVEKAAENLNKDEIIKEDPNAQKIYEDIEKLRESINGIKKAGTEEFSEVIKNIPQTMAREDSEDVAAAKKAVYEQAKKDALQEKAREEERIRKAQEAVLQQQKALEAQRRAALIEEEAEKRRLAAVEAEKKAKEAARKAALDAMEAQRKARLIHEIKQEDREKSKAVIEAATILEKTEGEASPKASPEEMAEFFGEKELADDIEKKEQELEKAKKELLFAQQQQEEKLVRISKVAERHTVKLAKEQQELIRKQAEELSKDISEREAMNARMLAEKEERAARARAEKEARNARLFAEREARAKRHIAEKEAKAKRHLAEKEAKAARLLAEREAKVKRLLAEKEEKRIKEEKRKLEKQRRAEERDLIKRARKDAEAKAKLEQLRLEQKSKADAELGGGIVNVQGVTINTEIKEVAHFKLRDFFSLKTKKERAAETEHEKRSLETARKERTEEAREIVDLVLKRAGDNFQKTKFAQKVLKMAKFCEKHKGKLLVSFAVLLIFMVGVAGVFNYYTAYAYSYNGQQLGLVKEKDDVLQITELVQNALTEDKSVDVVIDARKDISFERVGVSSEDKIDAPEDVLRRLTYMGDLNVKAYCIYVEGKKIAAVESKEVAEEVFRDIEERYKSKMDGAKVESIEIMEEWEGRKANISLERVVSKDEMVELLCADVEKESVHIVAAEETLKDIATTYSIKESKILEDNPTVTKKTLTTGDKLVIKQVAPLLTVKIVEKVTYDKVIEHKVNEKDSEDIYEGYSELQQEGSDGLSEITSKITLVNGQQVQENKLKTVVKQEPVTEIILIGVKERPPSVGSGKFIWPMKGGYTFTSGFKMRWGRMHEGIDLATPEGNDILAADGGIVTFAGWSSGYGYLIKIDHQNGYETRYAHNSKLLVSEGDEVFQGMHIAESGNTGRSTGAHLHFEIRVNGVAKDPLNYLP